MSSKRLTQLVTHGEITIGDTIQFDFKSNRFTATFSEGGVLHLFFWKKPSGAKVPIFKNKTFVTLSGWTEACIQEILQEFSTRYSSWKRVMHVKTGKSLDELWKSYMENRLKTVKKPTIEQMRQLNERLLEKLAKAREKIEDLTQDEATPSVQPIIMDSPHGTYMVLQRMIQTQNPNLDSIQDMGLKDFRKHLETFSKEKVIERGNISPQWFQECQQSQNKSHDVAKFVFDFFQKSRKRKLDIGDSQDTQNKRTGSIK